MADVKSMLAGAAIATAATLSMTALAEKGDIKYEGGNASQCGIAACYAACAVAEGIWKGEAVDVTNVTVQSPTGLCPEGEAWITASGLVSAKPDKVPKGAKFHSVAK